MNMEETKALCNKRLSPFGLKLEIVKDGYCESRFSSEPGSALQRIANPRAERPFYDPQSFFRWDLDQPWHEKRGFSERSLFLYLHDEESIIDWMRAGFRTAGGMICRGPDCLSARRLMGDFLEALKLAKDGRVQDGAKLVRDSILEKSGARPESLFNDLNAWLQSMLGPSQTNRHFQKGSLDPDLFRDGKGDFLAAKEIGQVFCAAEDASFLPAFKKAVKALERFLKLHDETFGGELLFVRALKKSFAQKFGNPEPRGAKGVKFEKARALFCPFHEAHHLLVLHANGAFETEDAQKFFENAAEDELAWQNGDVYGFRFTDRNGRETGESQWGFHGNDLENNGMLSAIESGIEKLANQKIS